MLAALLSGCAGKNDGRDVVYEDMKEAFDRSGLLSANIVPGGSFSLDGKTFRYGVLIPASEIALCLEEWGGQ